MESMNKYYDERAEEYDEIYSGKGPASISNPQSYTEDVENIKRILNQQDCSGTMLDIPSGTAFWMPAYCQSTEKILLVDQAKNMLDQAKKRAESLGILHKCRFIQGDVLKMEKMEGNAAYALVGFLISHLRDAEEKAFFHLLHQSMCSKRKIFLIDSLWTEERSQNRRKEGKQKRVLDDGSEFEIYKKYFSREEISGIATEYGYTNRILYSGKTMFMLSLEY